MTEFTPRRAFSGAPWEAEVGYCRAIRCGPHIWVTGCAPVAADGSIAAPGDAKGQTVRCLQVIDAALRDVGAEMRHVIRTRMFVTDIKRWPEIGAAHKAVFADHPPATTMVEVSALIDPAMLVEIEAEAFVPPEE